MKMDGKKRRKTDDSIDEQFLLFKGLGQRANVTYWIIVVARNWNINVLCQVVQPYMQTRFVQKGVIVFVVNVTVIKVE